MHELSIATALIEQARQVAAREGARKVLSVTLAIGDFSGVEEEPLRFCFPLAAEETELAGAKLVLRRVPGLLHCRSCGARTKLAHFSCICPACGANDTDLVEGREILMTAIEIDRAEEE